MSTYSFGRCPLSLGSVPADLPCHVGQRIYELAQQHIRANLRDLREEHATKTAGYHANLLPCDKDTKPNDRDVWISFLVTVPDPEIDIFADLLIGTGA